MIDARFVCLFQWPGSPTLEPQRSRFDASYASTLELLERELTQLNASNIVVQAYFWKEDVRNDGWPKSCAKPHKPGVILSFVSRKDRSRPVELSFPCDTYDIFDDNLRAIALTLEALRKIARYGVAQGSQQYKGWTQLPPPSQPQERQRMTHTEALNFVRDAGGTYGTVEDAYRRAAAVYHPDNRATGNHELFVKLQEAKGVLGL